MATLSYVFLLFYKPIKIVYEFQCSQLKPSEIIERTAGYSTLGYSCRWLVHESFLPLNSGRIIITKLSLFLEMCIFTHHNGKRTLTFLNPTLKKLTIFIIHYALAGHYYLVEIHRLVVNHPSQLLSQPKVTCLEEAEVIQAFNHHHLKQRRYLFQYYRPEDRIFHMLVKKWRKSEITLPYYIGLPSLSPHTLGNDFIWQFKLVNYHLTHYSALSSLSVEEIISNFLFSFPNANLDTAENWLAIRNYQQFLQLNRLPNRPFHLIKNTTPYIEKWYRFHILAKPSKD
ncbi:competence protein CoiA family protein [Chryseomicrobium sp. FSL W7-1435]|uniref:competence protein CoiA family protein n=1 Tax=Chryseomicrobium sp. FSL W7-1435 TaxID=2921704 RepID=UPI003159FB71